MNDKLDDRLDEELRDALRPVDPGDDFTRAVMARVASHTVTELRRPSAPRRFFTRALPRTLSWTPAALAASLLIAIFVTHEGHRQHDMSEGLRARQELLEALRVTSEKLDIAYQVVHNEANADADAHTDAGV
jgi:hypothetical protein